MLVFTHGKGFRIVLAAGEQPPTEFKVLSRGVNKTTKGDIVLSDRSIKSILANEKELGRDLIPFDYGHGQVGFVQGHEQARSAGWGTLDFRAGDMWVKAVDWTPTANKALSDREYRHFSPAVNIDPKTREVLSITNIALTNLPATKNQNPLVASDTAQSAAPPDTPETTSMDEKTLVKLFVALGVTDPGEILGKILSLVKERQQLFDGVKEIQAKLSVAEARLVTLDETKDQADKTALIERLSKEGKLPPALKDWAQGQSLSTVQSFSGSAPVANIVATPKTDAPTSTGAMVTLTEDEKKITKTLDITVEDYLKTKEDLSAQPFYFRTDPAQAPAVKETR